MKLKDYLFISIALLVISLSKLTYDNSKFRKRTNEEIADLEDQSNKAMNDFVKSNIPVFTDKTEA